MCGISGLILHSLSACASLNLDLEQINRRGPDGNGYWENKFKNHKIHFAHSRLSIIDLSNHAHQPMQDPNCDWVITYNGEIFNYLEIREELCGLGWSFHSQSDTEVLLKAWAQWGLDALPRLNGMFAGP